MRRLPAASSERAEQQVSIQVCSTQKLEKGILRRGPGQVSGVGHFGQFAFQSTW